MQPRIVFMGSPDFALPTLKALADHYHVVGVVTQPDRPAGRGRQLRSPVIKELALTLALPLIQPRRLREPEAMARLQAWDPDLIVVAAFGQILHPQVLDLPPHGCLNVHASLLPRWRGAAPVQAAIIHGDRETGVTIMKMDPGLDTGPILSQRAISIQPEDSGGVLSERLARLGAQLLLETLPLYLRGEITPRPQDETEATYAPALKRSDGQLDFSQSAAHLARQVRAYNPWPGAFITWKDRPLKIHQARVVTGTTASDAVKPGGRTVVDGLPAMRAADGLLVLERVQPAGRKAMPGDEFLHGAKEW